MYKHPLTSDNILASPEQHSSIPGHPLGVAVEAFLHRHSTKFWRWSNSTAKSFLFHNDFFSKSDW